MTGGVGGFIFRPMRRTLKKIVEGIAALVAVLVVAFLLLVWWVASKPMTSTFLTPTIEAALNHLVPDTRVKIDQTLIIWDNADHSIALRGEQVTLRDPSDNIVATFPSMKVKLSVLGLLRGRLIPADLGIEHPQLWFVRRADGTLAFGRVASVASESAQGEADLQSVREFAQQFVREVTREGLLHDLLITRAILSIHDEATGQDWTVGLPEISMHHDSRRLTGNMQVEVTQGDHVTVAQAHYAYERDGRHSVTVRFSDINPSFLAGRHPKLSAAAMLDLPLTGELSFTANKTLDIETASLRLEGGEGRLVDSALWDAPRTVKKLTLAASYDRATNRLDVPAAELDLDGPKLAIKMEGVTPSAEDAAKGYDMAFTVGIKLTDLPMDRFGAVWPKTIIPNARAWIAESMTHGSFPQGELTLRGKFAWNDLANAFLESGEGKIQATGARLNYLTGMPAIEGMGAEATFDLRHMDVKVTGGGVGPLKLLPSTIQITDFEKELQNIVIPVNLIGPARDVVTLIDSPPLGYAKAVGLKADDVDGRVEGNVELRFPLLADLKMDEIGITAKAQIFDFGSKNLIPGVAIEQGRLELNLDVNGFTVTGPAALNKVPMQVNFAGRFADEANKPRYQATVTGNLTGEQWGLLGVDMLSPMKGTSALTLNYVQPRKGFSQFAGDVNFRQAALRIDELNWTKPVGSPATLTFAADMPLGKNLQVKKLDLQGPDIRAKGVATLDGDTMRLLSVDLSPLRVGRTDASLHFAQALGDNGFLRFSVEGEAFDVSGLKGGKEPARTDPRPKDYALKLDKLYTSENGFIANAQGRARRDPLGWSEIDLHGLADGDHQLDITLAPQNGRRVFSITCDDFGKALKGMGFTDSVKGGTLEILGESSAEEPRVISGKAKVGSFAVMGLPALARLLNAASPFGFADLITGESSFDHLRGSFRWYGDEVDLNGVRAAGSVFGINIDGRVNLDTGAANLWGTLVPFSFFNSIINVIPLLGDVITGGEGQGVIAVSYSVKGSLADPNISVNPVSLLTPGFLRNLFFSGDDLDEKSVAVPEAPKPDAPAPSQGR